MLTIHIQNKLKIMEPDYELREYLKSLLTIDNPSWTEAQTFGRWTGNISKHLYLFSEDKHQITIPRGILNHVLYDLGREWNVNDHRVCPESEKIWPEGNITLRPNDQESAVQELMTHDNGFLSAAAGSGKTVMGLEICRRLGLNALWLTHRTELKDQVIQEAIDHLEIPKESIGIIHGKTWQLGEQLTIAMVPTLNKRNLTSLADKFGVVIVDEAHHVPSTTFLNVVENFNAKYLYGLTATAYRRDKLEAVMFSYIGPIITKIEHIELIKDEHLIQPLIRRRYTNWYPIKTPFMEYHDFMEAMVSATDRNNLIVTDIMSECVNGNYCMILVERTKHAEVLTDLLKDNNIRCEYVVGSINVDNVPIEKGQRKRKRQIPKKIREQIVENFKAGHLQALVATYDLLKEGFNFRPLNRLFLATPIKWRGSVVQALGRIQRTAEGKTDAIVYDYVDDQIGMFANQAESRLFRVYRKMNMTVEDT